MLRDPHPDDERLAAVAGAEPEALADPTLSAHVAACERCTGLVAELRSLRVALAELPDVAPPRPLQLVPPVELEAAPGPAGWAGLLRRLTAPAMALAVVLILVGAVGSTGSLLRSAATDAGGVTAEALSGGGQGAAAPSAAASAASSILDARGDYAAQPTPTAVPPKVPTSGGITGSVNGGASDQGASDQGASDRGASDRETPGPGTQGQGSGLPYGWFLGAGVVLLAGAFLVRARTARSQESEPAA